MRFFVRDQGRTAGGFWGDPISRSNRKGAAGDNRDSHGHKLKFHAHGYADLLFTLFVVGGNVLHSLDHLKKDKRLSVGVRKNKSRQLKIAFRCNVCYWSYRS